MGSAFEDIVTLSRGTDVNRFLGGLPRGRPVLFELRFLGGASTRVSGVVAEAIVVGTEPIDGSVLIGAWAREAGTEVSGVGSGIAEGATGVVRTVSVGSVLGVSPIGDRKGVLGEGGGGGWGVRNANGNVMASASVELREICAAVGGAGNTIGSSCAGEMGKSKA